MYGRGMSITNIEEMQERKKIVVYDLEKEEHPVTYGFSDVVPVRIFDGDCKVDFAEIDDYLGFLYENEGIDGDQKE